MNNNMDDKHASVVKSCGQPQPVALAVATGSGSRFVDQQRVLGEAEAWMQDVEMVDEEDRTEEESYALALWDELRRLRNLCREREHWGVGCTGLGEDFFLVALCENCGKPAVRLTEDGINLCRECYALCPEDTQNAKDEPRHE